MTMHQNFPTLAPGDPMTLLTAERRLRERQSLIDGEVVDVLVVGGGVTGAGVALDAATRGLSVALIEGHDLAFGTSRWSSKMVHGGLRYLAKGDVGVAWESAVERAHIGKVIAPHLVHPFCQLIPIFDDSDKKDRLAGFAGWRAGDVLRRASGLSGKVLPPPRRISAAKAIGLVPDIKRDGLKCAYIGYDFQLEDDARLVLAIARTAAAYGAKILTRTKAVQLHPQGASVQDTVDGATYDIRARNVINATGVWADQLDSRIELSPSRGTHLVLRSETLGHPSAALTVGVPGHFGRYVFAIPQFDKLVYVALTDVPAAKPIPDIPTPDPDEIQWILDVLNTGLGRNLTKSDVVGTFSGLRPLVGSPEQTGESTADVSRKHLVKGNRGEVITVVGGKLTTYRQMAEDAVDRITDRECQTTKVPLIGAGPAAPDPSIPARLLRRFGTEARLVAELANDNPDLLEPLAPDTAFDLRGVEVLWSRQAELVLGTDDFTSRRTRLSLIPEDEAKLLPQINHLLQPTARQSP